MIKLEGIIYKAFENFIVFRGYAPIGILSKVSKRPEAYQRMADETHKRDIIKFLGKKDYSYFPELVLAYRGADLNGLIDELHGKDDVEYNAESYVKGLKVLKERVPVSGYRARHAQLQVDDDTLLRVDGNHRLEAFDESDEWWKFFIEEEAPIGYSDEEKAQWLHHKVSSYKQEIENIIVPFSIVISNYDIADKFEASIFNNINFKQLPLKQEKNIQNVYKYLKDSDGKVVAIVKELNGKKVLTYKNGKPVTFKFNAMAKSLKEKKFMHDTFGKIVTPQVRDYLLNGNVALGNIKLEKYAAPQNFTLTVPATDNVTITAAYGEDVIIEEGDNAEIEQGAEVVLTVDVAEGYVLKSLTVTGPEGQSFSPAAVAGTEGAYKFTMPAYNATVVVTVEEYVEPVTAKYVLATSITSGTRTNPLPFADFKSLCDTTSFNNDDSKYFICA